MVLGEVIIYIDSHDDFSSEMTADENGIRFCIDSKGSHIYDVVVLKDSLDSPIDVSIYYDPEYPSVVEGVEVAVGAQPLTQDYYVRQLDDTLAIRGIDNVQTIDAVGLRELMSEDGTGHALIMLSGAIPDTVYDGTEDSSILKWISSGGRLYWAGNVLGKYIAHHDSLETVPYGVSLFMGSECIDDEGRTAYSNVPSNDFRDVLYLQNNDVSYAVDETVIHDRTYKGLGYTDGKHSSIGIVGLGDGMICILSGDYSNYQRIDMAQIIASGISPYTVIVQDLKGSVSGHTEGDLQKGDHVYVILGGFFPVYCELHRVVG